MAMRGMGRFCLKVVYYACDPELYSYYKVIGIATINIYIYTYIVSKPSNMGEQMIHYGNNRSSTSDPNPISTSNLPHDDTVFPPAALSFHQKLNGTESQRTADQVSCDRAIRYSGFFGVREKWVLLEISWNYC